MNSRYAAPLTILILLALLPGYAASRSGDAELNKLNYHNNPQRTGWNARETTLTPRTVSSGSFGPVWRTVQFDSFGGTPPRLFASPLYVDRVEIAAGVYKHRTLSIVYAITTTGYAYAVNAFPSADTPAGAILWRARLTEKPCFNGTSGNLSTPVIDLKTQRLYVTSCDDDLHWRAHALDIRSGREENGWPVRFDSTELTAINKNGDTEFGDQPGHIQRGALGLSPSGSRLYVVFATQGGIGNGWIVALNTQNAKVASAFSATARSDETQGGMWASGGPSIDGQGRVYIATGANYAVIMKKLGISGIFPDSQNNWGQSIIQLKDEPQTGFELIGTYTPFNYCQAAAADIDLGSSGTIVIDLDPRTTRTPQLLALGGGKQGNAYLLDRAHMPGGIIKRPPCSEDSASDGSLLSPNIQPQFARRGPVNVFTPYSDDGNMMDQAKSRTTSAYFRDTRGRNYLFVTGSSKTGEKLSISTPPGLARLEIITSPESHAYLQIDQLEQTQTFHNPGSPIVTSNAGESAIVWVLDQNAPRSSPLYGTDTPKPVLYAFDALSLQLLWKSKPGQLSASGKYNEPTVVRGTAFVGTDRIEAFALNAPTVAPEVATPGAIVATSHQKDDATNKKQQKQPGGAQQKIDAASIYIQRCASCHGSEQIGIIPTRTALATLPTDKIVFTLQYGSMQIHASGLREAELIALADYLTSSKSAIAHGDH